MARRSPRVPATVALLACALAACGGGGSDADGLAAGSPDSARTRTAAPEPSAADGSASLAGALVDLIPDQVGGVTLIKDTVAGPDLVDLEADDAASFAALLKNVEGPLEAFSAVNAVGTGLKIVAMRMEGTDGRQLGDAMVGVVVDAAERDAAVENVTVAGKDVKRITPADTTPIHIYVVGEVMFVVQSANRALVEAALAALP